MQVTINMCEPQTDQKENVLHITPVLIRSRKSAEKLAKQILFEANALWPCNKKEKP